MRCTLPPPTTLPFPTPPEGLWLSILIPERELGRIPPDRDGGRCPPVRDGGRPPTVEESEDTPDAPTARVLLALERLSGRGRGLARPRDSASSCWSILSILEAERSVLLEELD